MRSLEPNRLSARAPNSIAACSPRTGVVPDFSPTYNASDDEPGPRPSHQPVPPGSDHSHYCGSVPGSPSRPIGPATEPSIVPIDAPQSPWISPRVPKASEPTASDAEVLDESPRAVPLGYK